MKLQLVGCSHHSSSVGIRERLAFTRAQTVDALQTLQRQFPGAEAVLLSTCNRVELYLAANESHRFPGSQDLIAFLADFHGLEAGEIAGDLFSYAGEDAARHLFMVAASLDSMVVGEPQILSQVKQAFLTAQEEESVGPVTRHVFDIANRVAKRVATETQITRRRVSIPSVAVADYARRLFETMHDKKVLLLGAGEMGEETLRYLRDEGARQIVILDRSQLRAEELATRVGGTVDAWEQLENRLVWADLVVSATGAREPIVTLDDFRAIEHNRAQRLLFILDLAVPRDFQPEIGNCSNVYLYCIDDLQAVCEKNMKARQKEWPQAERIVDEETARFMADVNRRVTGPTIQQLKQQADELKSEELHRLMNKLGELDDHSREEIERSFDRLVNKLLHPPLESLRHEASQGSPHRLLNSLRHLFQLPD
jgi:glutamyl-tRNA reductase